MAHPVVIRTQKLSSMGAIKRSGSHTWRERPTPNADAERTPANTDLRPANSAATLAAAVKARLELATETATEKPVLCIEYLVTARHEAFKEGGGSVDPDAYFRDALAFLEKRHGKDNIVAANIQRDESTPHLVVYAVPIVEVEAKTRKRNVIVGTNEDGTKRRETREYHQPATVRLSAQHYQGKRDQLSQLQTDFAEQVGKRHGLARGVKGSKAEHKTIRQFYGELGTLASDPRLKPKSFQRMEALPDAPGLLEQFTEGGREKARLRAEAEARNTAREAANKAARQHNIERDKLLTKLAGQGVERRNAEAERQRQAQQVEQARHDERQARAERDAMRKAVGDKVEAAVTAKASEKDQDIDHWKAEAQRLAKAHNGLVAEYNGLAQHQAQTAAQLDQLRQDVMNRAPELAKEIQQEEHRREQAEQQRHRPAPGMSM
jgi:hypothetical protein